MKVPQTCPRAMCRQITVNDSIYKVVPRFQRSDQRVRAPHNFNSSNRRTRACETHLHLPPAPSSSQGMQHFALHRNPPGQYFTIGPPSAPEASRSRVGPGTRTITDGLRQLEVLLRPVRASAARSSTSAIDAGESDHEKARSTGSSSGSFKGLDTSIFCWIPSRGSHHLVENHFGAQLRVRCRRESLSAYRRCSYRSRTGGACWPFAGPMPAGFGAVGEG